MTSKITAPIALLITALSLPATAYALCVTVPEANLRQGPDTHYEISWQVPRYMPFKQIGKQGKWYQVEDVDGDTHWIYSPLVSRSMRCAVVKVDSANVRTGPGTQHDKSEFSPVEKYYTFQVIGPKGAWVNVQDEYFDNAWVAKPLLWIQ